jgi:hypothetical protein
MTTSETFSHGENWEPFTSDGSGSIAPTAGPFAGKRMHDILDTEVSPESPIPTQRSAETSRQSASIGVMRQVGATGLRST